MNRRSFFTRLLAGATLGLARNLPMPESPVVSSPPERIVESLYDCTEDQNLYVALFTEWPLNRALSIGKEVSGAGYARQKLSMKEPTVFPPATSDWGTVRAYGYVDGHGRLIMEQYVHPRYVGTEHVVSVHPPTIS